VTRVKVLIFSAYFPPAFLGGGALKSVAAIVSQAPGAYDASVITADRDLGERETLDVVGNTPLRWGDATVYYASHSFRHRVRAFKYAHSFKPQIVYTNSFFDPAFSILPLVMWRLGLVRSQHFVIAPRGEFGPGALNIKRVKKSLLILAYRLFLGSRRVTWHASSPDEAANIRGQVGLSAQIIVREDNTALPPTAALPTQPGPGLRAVVIGRVVPVKGIEELLQALAGVSLPVVLDIYGPEEDRVYAQRCRRLAAELPAHISANFRGAIPSTEVATTLRTYDLMLLPSRGENFSHVVAEALSVSLPVMCADVTPWSSYIADGGGVLLDDNSAHSWTKSIDEYAGTSTAYKMSKRNAAGHQYERWRDSTQVTPHVFDLIMSDKA
jgi:glycosyltransferase involved in cell wall biosynthesis